MNSSNYYSNTQSIAVVLPPVDDDAATHWFAQAEQLCERYLKQRQTLFGCANAESDPLDFTSIKAAAQMAFAACPEQPCWSKLNRGIWQDFAKQLDFMLDDVTTVIMSFYGFLGREGLVSTAKSDAMISMLWGCCVELSATVTDLGDGAKVVSGPLPCWLDERIYEPMNRRERRQASKVARSKKRRWTRPLRRSA